MQRKMNVETNTGKTFLKLIDKHFPKSQQVPQNIQQKQCQS